MRSASRRGLVPGALLALVLGSGTLAEDVFLRWQHTEGQRLREIIDTEGSTTVVLAGETQTTRQTMRLTILRTVNKVDEQGTAALTQRIERVELKVAGPGVQAFDYDSENATALRGPLAKLVGPIFKALVGAEITQRMTRDGVVKDVTLPPGLLVALKAAPGAESLGDFLSDEGLKRLSSQFPALGIEPITRGKTFEDRKQVKLPVGVLEVLSTYTYDGLHQHGAKELHKLNIQVSPSLQPVASEARDVRLKPGPSSGALYFDGELGRAVAMEVKYSGGLELSGGGKTLGSMTESMTRWRLEELGKQDKEAKRQ